MNNIKDDEPFSGKKLGGNVVNGIVQSFIPGVSSTTAKSILRNVGGFIFDPTKSPSEKWQVSSPLLIGTALLRAVCRYASNSPLNI